MRQLAFFHGYHHHIIEKEIEDKLWKVYYDDGLSSDRPRHTKIKYAYQSNKSDCGIFVIVTAELMFFTPSVMNKELNLSEYLSPTQISDNNFRYVITVLISPF